MVSIDGSYGEGGGQILRTALSLSSVTGKAFRLVNIRKNRPKPGLMPQHLACVHALQLITGARVSGAVPGSRELTFEPGPPVAGSYTFDIGTAGSSSLVLQAVLPPLAVMPGSSSVSISGGTHVMTSPVYQYIENVFAPLLEAMDIRLRSRIDRYGFYPKGGGRIAGECVPPLSIRSINFRERGTIQSVRGVSVVAGLPSGIANRQRDAACRVLARVSGLDVSIETRSVSSPGPGTLLFLRPEGEGLYAGFSALGARGRPAEKVGEEAAAACVQFLKGGACFDEHITDQIALYCALSEGQSVFTTSKIGRHLLTNLWTISRFLDIEYAITGDPDSAGEVRIRGDVRSRCR